jgi:hypothetical protein
MPGMTPQAQAQPMSPQANQLAQQPQPQVTQPNQIQKGSILIFPYQFWKNDPTPCVMISSVNGTVLKGINLHYLTFNYIKRLMPNANNPGFSYYNIKADQYIVSAYRSYLVRGIMFEKSRVIDAKFLLQMMSMVNSFDPLQIRAIRQEIERQLATGYQQPQAAPAGPNPYGNNAAQQAQAQQSVTTGPSIQ